MRRSTRGIWDVSSAPSAQGDESSEGSFPAIEMDLFVAVMLATSDQDREVASNEFSEHSNNVLDTYTPNVFSYRAAFRQFRDDEDAFLELQQYLLQEDVLAVAVPRGWRPLLLNKWRVEGWSVGGIQNPGASGRHNTPEESELNSDHALNTPSSDPPSTHATSSQAEHAGAAPPADDEPPSAGLSNSRAGGGESVAQAERGGNAAPVESDSSGMGNSVRAGVPASPHNIVHSTQPPPGLSGFGTPAMSAVDQQLTPGVQFAEQGGPQRRDRSQVNPESSVVRPREQDEEKDGDREEASTLRVTHMSEAAEGRREPDVMSALFRSVRGFSPNEMSSRMHRSIKIEFDEFSGEKHKWNPWYHTFTTKAYTHGYTNDRDLLFLLVSYLDEDARHMAYTFIGSLIDQGLEPSCEDLRKYFEMMYDQTTLIKSMKMYESVQKGNNNLPKFSKDYDVALQRVLNDLKSRLGGREPGIQDLMCAQFLMKFKNAALIDKEMRITNTPLTRENIMKIHLQLEAENRAGGAEEGEGRQPHFFHGGGAGRGRGPRVRADAPRTPRPARSGHRRAGWRVDRGSVELQRRSGGARDCRVPDPHDLRGRP